VAWPGWASPGNVSGRCTVGPSGTFRELQFAKCRHRHRWRSSEEAPGWSRRQSRKVAAGPGSVRQLTLSPANAKSRLGPGADNPSRLLSRGSARGTWAGRAPRWPCSAVRERAPVGPGPAPWERWRVMSSCSDRNRLPNDRFAGVDHSLLPLWSLGSESCKDPRRWSIALPGALGAPIREITARRGWAGFGLHCLPAPLPPAHRLPRSPAPPESEPGLALGTEKTHRVCARCPRWCRWRSATRDLRHLRGTG